MPELLVLDDADRRDWLRSYHATFLERDLADLTRLSDLQPFRALQRIVMLRTGKLGSYLAIGLGLLLVAGPLILTLPTKASGADELNAAAEGDPRRAE